MSSTILINYSYLGPGGNISVAILLPLLCIAAVAARIWGRLATRAGVKSDDWLILFSLLLYIGMAICILVGVSNHALGYPTPKPTPGSPADEFLYFTSPQQQLVGKLEQAILWQQVFQLGLAKASVVMFYRRIFLPMKTERWFGIATIILLVFIVAWAIAFFFVLLFACRTRFYANWTTVSNLVAFCHGSQDGQMSWAITDFVTDIFIISLPLPMVWKLHLPISRKIAVSAAFLLGALAVAASCLRMAIYIIVDTSFINPKQDGDWTVDLFLFWSVVESGLCILASCLPSLLFLWKRLRGVTVSALRSFRSVFSFPLLLQSGQDSRKDSNAPSNGMSRSNSLVPKDFDISQEIELSTTRSHITNSVEEDSQKSTGEGLSIVTSVNQGSSAA